MLETLPLPNPQVLMNLDLLQTLSPTSEFSGYTFCLQLFSYDHLPKSKGSYPASTLFQRSPPKIKGIISCLNSFPTITSKNQRDHILPQLFSNDHLQKSKGSYPASTLFQRSPPKIKEIISCLQLFSYDHLPKSRGSYPACNSFPTINTRPSPAPPGFVSWRAIPRWCPSTLSSPVTSSEERPHQHRSEL